MSTEMEETQSQIDHIYNPRNLDTRSRVKEHENILTLTRKEATNHKSYKWHKSEVPISRTY